VEVIIANLPYVRKAELANTSFEPRLALDGGEDGLDQIRRLAGQLKGRLRPGGYVLLEIGQGQPEAVTSLFSRLLPSTGIEVTPDLAGIDRVVSLHLGEG
jgi:release factor glutamine methyltransferase